MYRRASNKQLEYIAALCDELDIINPTLYSKYQIEAAAKLINQLKRKVTKKRERDRQLKLL